MRVRVPREQPRHAVRVTDVAPLPAKALDLRDEPLGDRHGGRLGTEEASAHVVLEPDHVEALRGEEADGLGADEPARTRDDRYRHRPPQPILGDWEGIC